MAIVAFIKQSMNQQTAQKIIQQTAHDYNCMSEKFDQTRSFAWADFEYFKPYIKPNASILDYGCGNGRLVDWLKPFQPKSYLGVDISEKLLNIARNRYQNMPWVEFRLIDTVETQHAMSLQPNNSDCIFCLAVLHHIPSKELRQQLVSQFYQWLKPGGYLFLTNWNLKQKKFRPYRLKYKLKWLLGQSGLNWQDLYYPFKNNQGQILAQRYLHAFTKSELKRTLQESGFNIIYNHAIKNNLITIVNKET